MANPELSDSILNGALSRGMARMGPEVTEFRRDVKASFSSKVHDQGSDPQRRLSGRAVLAKSRTKRR